MIVEFLEAPLAAIGGHNLKQEVIAEILNMILVVTLHDYQSRHWMILFGNCTWASQNGEVIWGAALQWTGQTGYHTSRRDAPKID